MFFMYAFFYFTVFELNLEQWFFYKRWDLFHNTIFKEGRENISTWNCAQFVMCSFHVRNWYSLPISFCIGKHDLDEFFMSLKTKVLETVLSPLFLAMLLDCFPNFTTGEVESFSLCGALQALVSAYFLYCELAAVSPPGHFRQFVRWLALKCNLEGGPMQPFRDSLCEVFLKLDSGPGLSLSVRGLFVSLQPLFGVFHVEEIVSGGWWLPFPLSVLFLERFLGENFIPR